MKTFLKVLGGLVLVALLFLAIGAKDKGSVGGNFNPVPVDFAAGLTATSITVSNAVQNAVLSLGSTTAGVYEYSPVITPVVDTTLTAAQSGATFALGTAGVDLTLPAVASSNGVHYKFVISAAYATTSITVNSAEGDNIEGTLLVAGAVVDCTANDLITSVNDGEDIGDFFELYSNGTTWFIGQSGALTASKLTCTG